MSIGRAKAFFRYGAAENVSRFGHACRKSAERISSCEQLAEKRSAATAAPGIFPAG
jgi:hypothetical protein